MDDEQKRHIAELEGKVRELEAAVRMWQERWASVPWDALLEVDPAVLASLSQRAQEVVKQGQQESIEEDARRTLDEMWRDYERFLYESWLRRFRAGRKP